MVSRETRNSKRKEKLASYFYDLSKMSFAALFVGVMIPLLGDTANLTLWSAAFIGVALTVVMALFANNLMK